MGCSGHTMSWSGFYDLQAVTGSGSELKRLLLSLLEEEEAAAEESSPASASTDVSGDAEGVDAPSDLTDHEVE